MKQKFNVTDLVLAEGAKQLCSAVFVSQRDSEEAFKNSIWPVWPLISPPIRQRPVYAIDRQAKAVTFTLGDSVREARLYGDQGCTIIPLGADGIYFEPVCVKTTLPSSMTQLWPMGDVLEDGGVPPEVDMAKIDAAVNTVFENAKAKTAAFVVVYKRRIIAERYREGINKDTQLESWSMGKSLTATLIGILLADGHFDLHSKAPVSAWQNPNDSRKEITIAHLLRMSSGLKFTGPEEVDHTSDHSYIYSGAIDVFKFSIDKPLEFDPNTVGRYRNCDPLILGHIVKQTVESRGEEYFTFPQRALFDKIGIHKMVLEADPYGNFIMTGYVYGTARNWARLGLLYLQDGKWAGERILPEGFVDFVRSPAPAWADGTYGGLFWLNPDGSWGLPTDTYSMQGAGGQFTFIVPSYDLVIARMSHMSRDFEEESLIKANQQIISAIHQNVKHKVSNDDEN